MGLDINPVGIGRRILDKADDVRDKVVENAAEAASNVARGAETVAGAARFQGDMARAGLERAFSAGRNVAANFRLPSIDTTPGADNPPPAQGLEFAETKGASSLAYNARVGEKYQFPDGRTWEVADVASSEGATQSGFRAIALKNGSEVIVAYAGTDPKSPGDIANDLAQGVGFAPTQYRQAAEFAQKWENQAGAENVTLTGHSLGGGLAAYASIKTGLRATTVNSAPLALTNVGGNPLSGAVRNNPNITNYYVPGEALTVLDGENPLDMRPGADIAVEGRGSILNPLSVFNNHLLGNTAPDVPLPQRVN